MKNYSAKEIKNIVLIGAPGTGKTTLAEAMAFEGKVIDRRGSIETNNTLSDNTDIEHEYKRSIYSTLLFTEFMERKLNIIDCPGSDDFCGSLFSAFKVGDIGIMVFNAQNGWEVGSEIQARYARILNKPLIGFVNQLDSEKANFEATIESIRAASGVKPVLVQYPVNPGPGFNAFIDVLLMKMYRFKDENGTREELEIPAEEMERAAAFNKELVEVAAEYDDALMELYFEKGTLTQDDIRSGLKLGVAHRQVMPIFCGSAKRDIGTKRLMEFIINVAPGPMKASAFLSTEGEEILADDTAPTVAFVFKSQLEQHIGEISYFRVVRGKLTEGMELTNTRTGNKEKISQLFAVAGKNRIKVTELSAGDIGCTVKLKGTRTNDTLSAPSAPVTIDPIVFPEPRYRAAIKTKDQADDEKLGKILNDAKYEDPTILVDYSKELKQTIIQGQGEHHLNILRSRIGSENKVQFEYVAPKIPYRETITKVAQADYRHKKQSGGAGQFGEVHMIIEPYYEGMPEPKTYKIPGKGELTVNIKNKEEYDLPWGGKLQFYSAIVGGAIDARFMPAILKGIMEKMDEGPLTGSYARDIRAIIYDGKMHPVDSNEISFKLAARNAFKEAFRNAGPKIMEPIYDVEVLTPSEYMGAVMSDLQNRRAMIMGMESDKGFDRLNARVPLAELYRYSTSLSSLSSGAATYTMKFASYEQVPSDVQEKLLKEYTDTDEE
ncbi:MAG TPA: elongation factor G [Candidatus Alistipes avicola]|uniref:Elongation factor G n=1 Tax=Candidatus Alistipes avicola TaxID=2838432 RepID=A0A9D2IEE8_9BACT|nr:elongation factor G [uncultured Alistipes sp.]HJA98838.1 elongation factor G [Candidatus Alistipes avicola]